MCEYCCNVYNNQSNITKNNITMLLKKIMYLACAVCGIFISACQSEEDYSLNTQFYDNYDLGVEVSYLNPFAVEFSWNYYGLDEVNEAHLVMSSNKGLCEEFIREIESSVKRANSNGVLWDVFYMINDGRNDDDDVVESYMQRGIQVLGKNSGTFSSDKSRSAGAKLT